MRIAFVDATSRDYTPETPLRFPLGGMQSAICYLSVELAARGHLVSLFNNTSTPGTFNQVRCTNFSDPRALRDIGASDVIVAISTIGERLRRAGIKVPAIYWIGHDIDQAAVRRLELLSERESWTRIAFKSEWQRDRFVRTFPIDPARTALLRNAMSPAFLRLPRRSTYFFESPALPVLAYTSTPFRGLGVLARAFPLVQRQLPGISARIYSGMAVYGRGAEDAEFARLYDLCRSTDGVDYIGSVDQQTLAEGLAACDILAYPSTFAETACTSFIEAASAGCLLISTDLGALPETGSGYAFLMPTSGRNLDSRQMVFGYARHLVETIRAAYANPAEFRKKIDAQVDFFRKNYTWPGHAAEWELLFENLIGPTSPLQRSQPADDLA